MAGEGGACGICKESLNQVGHLYFYAPLSLSLSLCLCVCVSVCVCFNN